MSEIFASVVLTVWPLDDDQVGENDLGTLTKKKTGKCGNFEKKTGGVYLNPTFCFTVFNMGEPPTINVPTVLKCKINHILFFTNMGFPNLGEGVAGVPTWEKFPHFPIYFF